MRAILCCLVLFLTTVALAQEPPKKLTAIDLSVETHKWDGKVIQTMVQCFFADTDEYRCAVLPPQGGDLVRIDFNKISPPEMKKTVEDNCDTIEKMTTRACRFQVVFTYSGNNRQENNNGSIMMMIIPDDSAGTFSRIR
jgi:hypothetical protein